MNVEKVFGMEVLTKEDAWFLFRETAGTCVNDAGLNSIAKEVVKECRGLPIALSIVGSALKDENDKRIWKDALTQLRKASPNNIPDFIKEVYNPIKVSYDKLEPQEAKSVFLLCCLFGEDDDISLECLIYFCMGLAIFEGGMEEARNKMSALIKRLKSRSLLLDGRNEDYVRMHHVVRDVCIFIVKEKGYIGGNDCPWISSFHTTAGERIKLPTNLRLLFLSGDYSELEEEINKFSNSLVEGIRDLHVLFIENYSSLTSLQYTIESLRNLRTLVLCSCEELETISVVGELVNLEILDCHNSYSIKELPPEMKQLNRLKLLDLTRCRNLERIGRGIISSLVGLEELKMLDSFKEWEAARDSNERENGNATVTELEALTNLRCLEIEIDDPALAAENMRLSLKLERFQIRIGHEFSSYSFNKTMSLKWEGETCAGEWIEMQLIRDAECLCLTGYGVGEWIYYLAKSENIRWLELGECETMKNIGRTTMDGATVFPFIEHLSLYSLPRLEEILDGPISSNYFHNLNELKLEDLPALMQLWNSSSSQVFPNLKKVELDNLPILAIFEFPLQTISSIKIKRCPRLRNLGRLSIAGHDCLSQLQTLVITDCEMMEPVILWNEEEWRETKTFPKLKEVELDNVPYLTTFEFPLQTISSIKIKRCPRLRNLGQLSIAGHDCLSQLQTLVISDCEMMEQVILLNEEEWGITKTFPKLEVKLSFLPNLATFEFPLQTISSIKIKRCPRLRNLGRLSIAGHDCLSQLQTLVISDCEMMEQVILLNEEEWGITKTFPKLEVKLSFLPNLATFEYPLQTISSIKIKRCPRLRNLGQLSIAGHDCLSQLQTLVISDCEMMEQVILLNEEEWRITKTFPKLKEVELSFLPNLATLYQGIGGIEFPLLMTMRMKECPKLKSIISSKENSRGGSSNAGIDDDYSSHLFCQPHKVSFGSLEILLTDQNPFCGHEVLVSSFKGLEKLEIFGYKDSMSLFTSSIARNFVSLRILSISKCDEMVQVIQDEEEKTVSGGQKTILFPNLQELELRDLRKLVRFGEWKCDIELPSLSQVIIVKCPMMTNFTSEQCMSAIAQLQILHIEECEMMEQVISWNEEDNQRYINTTPAFSELRFLRLKSLPKLTSLCKGIESFEFPQLIQRQVEDCPLLMDKFFSMNLFLEPDKVKMEIWNEQRFRNAEYLSLEGNAYRNLDVREVQNMRWLTFRECSRGTKLVNVTTMDTLFPQLEVLRLLKLTELEEIWEIDGPIESNSFKNLKELRLEFLPALKHLWQSNSSSSQMNVVSIFSKLSCLYIYGCHQLYSLFSLQVTAEGSCLLQLEELVIESCDRMEHIFFWNEGENKSNIHIQKLKVLILDSLPKLTCFCRGSEGFEFPSLDRKRISRCPLLENFVSTDNHDDDYIHLFCKPDNKVQEKMELKLQGNITLGRNKIQECVEYMSFEGDGSTSSDFGVGESIRCLTFRECSMGTKLMNMTTIATLFPLIKVLTLRECSMGTKLMNMTTIATPFPLLEVMCLVNITELEEIWDIDGPKNINELRLKSLPALKHLWQSSSSPSQMNAVPIFSKLSSIYIYGCHELCNLFSLSVMATGSCLLQLENLAIESCEMLERVFLWNEEESQRSIILPKLKVLKLDSLPRLMSFCEGTESFEFPLLVEMRISRCPLLQNLVSTNQSPIDHDHDSMHFFCKRDKVSFGSLKVLSTARNPFFGHKILVSSFNGLVELRIIEYRSCTSIFSSSIARNLLSLRVLDISKCDEMVQVIQDEEEEEEKVNAGDQRTLLFPKLENLALRDLCKLEAFCEWKSDVELPSLIQVVIVRCPKITNFTRGKDCIAKLEILNIEECEMMEEVYLWNDEDQQSDIDTTLVFSELKSLSLKSLGSLSSLCKGIESFEFPMLTQIQVEDCPVLLQNVVSINLFSKSNKAKMEKLMKDQPFRNAEYLSLEGDSYRNLDCKEVHNMHWMTFRESSMGTKLVNLTAMDTLFPRLEVLRVVKLTELEEMWVIDSPIPSNSFQNLKELRLEFLPAMKHLWLSSSPSQMNAVSIFNKLSCLHIYGCHDLCNLYSLPVTEMNSCLLLLEELVIESCDRMEHVFLLNEGENQSIIHIPNLKVLTLDSLPKLTSFCRGIESFDFPSRVQKRISRCPRLENLVSTDWSPGDIHLLCKSENKVQKKMDLKLQGNITLRRNKLKKCVEYYMTSEGDGSTSLDLGVANNMRCLTFTEFSMGTKLMNMMTIATVFPLLEVMCLVNITELEEIWDIDGPKNLNELRLKSLPALRHLWQIRSSPSQMNVDVSIFNKLSCIYIYGCPKLRNLFPLSMMGRGSYLLQLERLEIENCEIMEQVFLWNGENIHVEKFPKLKFLSLSFLPKLRNICKGIERIQCPQLDKMKIINCPRLESLVYWDKELTFIFNSLRSSQLERRKGANTALQPHMFKREEKRQQQQQKKLEEKQRPTHRRRKTM